jgi:uncharacterized LabA/DUF88 family protein
MERARITVFLDTENLTHWIKEGGPERLLLELSGIGQIIVRRAYGRWTNQNLQPFQSELNRQGFELIHYYHPVSGKNSSDIQLTVDVMEYALRLTDVTWFVLATGDSDFSPLFRRLREMGKEVFGVGPRSPLSESVKTSCSRYIYTDATTRISKEVLRSALDDAIDLAETALKTFGGPASCSALKVSITNLDSAFDEKSLGFKSFTDFLRSTESITTNYDSENNTWYACFSSSECEASSSHLDHGAEAGTTTEELYRKILRKKHWRSVPKPLLLNIYKQASSFEALTKTDLAQRLAENLGKDATTTDIKKAISILMKSKLFTSVSRNGEDESEEKAWKIYYKQEFLQDVDLALLVRLFGAVNDIDIKHSEDAISGLLYGAYTNTELRTLIATAFESISTKDDKDTPVGQQGTEEVI